MGTIHLKSVLSLFDGARCGAVALDKAGITYDKYFASEIDKYAKIIANKNYPNAINLGDVNNYTLWDSVEGFKWEDIDLVMGGSPCQDLSIAKSDRRGLEGNRSGLFFRFVEILHYAKPKYFLLENVASMSKADRDVITSVLGVKPIMINSALLSAQQRKRLYWTNIPVFQPKDRHIFLKDIIDPYTEIETKASDKNLFKHIKTLNDKSNGLTASMNKGIGNDGMTTIIQPVPCALRTRIRGGGKCLEVKHDDKCNALTSVNTDSMICEPLRIGTIGRGGARSKNILRTW